MGSKDSAQQQQQQQRQQQKKLKKKKPTKIIAGKGFDDGKKQTNNQWSKKPENNARKSPTGDPNKAQKEWNKPSYERTKKINQNQSSGSHTKQTNAKTTQTKSYQNNSRQRGGNWDFIARVQSRDTADTIRKFLTVSNAYPEQVKYALGTATLELDQQREFVVHKQDPSDKVNYNALRKMLQKNALPGWLEWFQGRRGWVMATNKTPYVNYHREIHEAYTTAMRSLLKKADPDLKRCLVVLYYKPDPLTQENGGCPRNGVRQNTHTLWKKAAEKESLQDAVGKVRPFLEVLRYFCTDPKDKWTTLPWLVPSINRSDCAKRLDRISDIVFRLMRTSERGPDVPVHWAAHPPLNHYPRSTITSKTMDELVIGLTNIISNLFLCYPITVDNLDGVKKVLRKFSSTSLLAGGSGGDGSAMRRSSSGRAKAADNIDPLLENLNGLSISND